MIKIFKTQQIKELDQLTMLKTSLSSAELVENVATLFTNEFIRHFDRSKHLYIFAGPGNNGADALAIARLLIERNYNVNAYLINSPSVNPSPACLFHRDQLKDIAPKNFVEIVHEFIPPTLHKEDVVIDGLFGSGLNRPITGGFAGMIKYINACPSTIVSIDIPSGLLGESNSYTANDIIIKAHQTFTFEFPKLSLLMPENEKYFGTWKILPINLDPEAKEQVKSLYYLVTENDISKILKPRSRFAHKGNFGHALLIAGSRGKMGAALLATKATLRSGVGLVTAHIPSRGETIFQTALPEAMISIDENDSYFQTVPDLEPYNAIGIGPGLGTDEVTRKALFSLLQTNQKPMVIDADALNLIANNEDLLNALPKNAIITPHPKEFDRLAGKSINSFQRIEKTQDFAIRHNVIIVLKGGFTIICLPDGKVYFNSCGNPGMATAGSGDVLTGIILALLAQGYPPDQAAIAAVYIHGTAGDLYLIRNAYESLIASDLIDFLGSAFRQLK